MPADSGKRTGAPALRVLIVDDHTLFRSGLRELLARRGIEVVASVGDGEEGLRLAEELRPDVVLLDVRMPVTGGLQVLEQLDAANTGMPVVMLTTSTEERDLVEALRHGARGYLLKDMEPNELVESLARITSGDTVVAPEFDAVLTRMADGTPPVEGRAARLAELTPRETEILRHLAEGQSNKVIAAELGIADGTVKLHVRSILRKLQVRSRVEAAVLAVEEGMHQD